MEFYYEAVISYKNLKALFPEIVGKMENLPVYQKLAAAKVSCWYLFTQMCFIHIQSIKEDLGDIAAGIDFPTDTEEFKAEWTEFVVALNELEQEVELTYPGLRLKIIPYEASQAENGEDMKFIDDSIETNKVVFAMDGAVGLTEAAKVIAPRLLITSWTQEYV